MLSWINQNLLTVAIFLPFVGMAAIAAIPREKSQAVKYVAISSAIITLLACIAVYIKAGGSGEYELMRTIPWIPSLGIFYRVGVDGVSSLLIILTALLVTVALLSSWHEIEKRQKLFYALILFIETGLIGTFAAMDMFLFYVFWDAALIPMCFIIGIWGSGDRIRAATKFLIFTLFGSVLMLVAIIYASSVVGSFNLLDWYANEFARGVQLWLFLGFAIAFAIKAPLFGFHTWLPDAHAEAPTAGSIILAGVMLKLGGYGLFRIAIPLFPEAVVTFQPIVLGLAVISIIGGALIAMVQEDLKRLIAYSSVSHMGFVVLGLFAVERYAATGAVFQMAAHGLIVAGMFAIAGFLYERKGTRLISDYGGSARSLPMISIVFIVFVLAALGLPGLMGFVGEFFILLGSFQTKMFYAGAAVIGVVIAAAYMIWLVQRMFFGALKFDDERKMPDMRAREYLCVLPLILIIVISGIWPKEILGRIWRPADAFVSLARRGTIVVPVRDDGAFNKRWLTEDHDIALKIESDNALKRGR